MESTKKNRSQLVWLAVFVVGFAALFLIGSQQCADAGFARPYIQGGVHYTLFCNWPFQISQVFGAPWDAVATNVKVLAIATFFLVCGLGLYLPAYGYIKDEARERLLHFYGSIVCCSYLCSGVIGSSLYNTGLFHFITAWFGLGIAVRVFLRQMKRSRNKLWTLCIYAAGFCFVLAVAGYTRALWILGLCDKCMLPIYAAKLMGTIANWGNGGVAMLLLSIVLQTALALLFCMMWLICRQQQKHVYNLNDLQFWGQILMFPAMYMIYMLFFDSSSMTAAVEHFGVTSSPLALKYWVAILVSALLLGFMAPKGCKRPLRSLVVIGMPMVVYALICSFAQFYDTFYTAFEKPLARIDARRTALFAMIDPDLPEMVEKGTGVGMQFILGVGVVLVLFVLLLIGRRLYRKINASAQGKGGYLRDGYMHLIWCALTVLGVTVRCLDLPYRFVSIIAYGLFSPGAIGLLILVYVCLRQKDKAAMKLLLVDAVGMALAITLAAHFALEIGVLALVLFGAATMMSFMEFHGGGSRSDDPGELSAAQQFSMAIAMDSTLSAIDAGVASGAFSAAEGSSMAYDVISAASGRGFFGGK